MCTAVRSIFKSLTLAGTKGGSTLCHLARPSDIPQTWSDFPPWRTPKQQSSRPNAAAGLRADWWKKKDEPVQLFRGMSRWRTPTAAWQPFSQRATTTVWPFDASRYSRIKNPAIKRFEMRTLNMPLEPHHITLHNEWRCHAAGRVPRVRFP